MASNNPEMEDLSERFAQAGHTDYHQPSVHTPAMTGDLSDSEPASIRNRDRTIPVLNVPQQRQGQSNNGIASLDYLNNQPQPSINQNHATSVRLRLWPSSISIKNFTKEIDKLTRMNGIWWFQQFEAKCIGVDINWIFTEPDTANESAKYQMSLLLSRLVDNQILLTNKYWSDPVGLLQQLRL
jgi:hypothetical protein